MRNTRSNNSSKTKTAQLPSAPKSDATQAVAAHPAGKAKVAKKATRRKAATGTTSSDVQGDLPTTPSPESATALSHQAELDELRRIIASQKKKLDDARIRGQRPSTPSTPTETESSRSEPRTDWQKNTGSPQRGTSSSPFLLSSPFPQRYRQPLAPRPVALNSAIVNEALGDGADPCSSPEFSQNQPKKPPKHKRADIWQKVLGFETRREYLDFKTSLKGIMIVKGINFKKCATEQHLPVIANIRNEIFKNYPRFNAPKFVNPVTRLIGDIVRDNRRNLTKVRHPDESRRPVGRPKRVVPVLGMEEL